MEHIQIPNIMKIKHTVKEFPHLQLDYDLTTKEVSISKVIGETEDSPGYMTTLDLTVDETLAILCYLETNFKDYKMRFKDVQH